MDNPAHAIQRLDIEIGEEADKCKNLKEQVAQLREEMPEFKEVERLSDELADARIRLRVALERTSSYTTMKEQVAESDFKLKDLREILSHHLTRYWRETDENQILLPDGKNAKQIIVTGKLGKVDAYQERMQLTGGVK